MSLLHDSPVFQKMKDIFSRSLDSYWFALLAENSPLALCNLRELREFINNPDEQLYGSREILGKLDSLQEVILNTQRYLMPVLKERLQISPLAPDDMVDDRDERLMRRCVAYTLPYNLIELSRLVTVIRGWYETEACLLSQAPAS